MSPLRTWIHEREALVEEIPTNLSELNPLRNASARPRFRAWHSGLSQEGIESGGKALILFGLGLVFVYLTLAAQYESFVGAGKAGSISVGTTVFGGMIAATLLNLIFLPLLYAVVFPAAEKPRSQTRDAHS